MSSTHLSSLCSLKNPDSGNHFLCNKLPGSLQALSYCELIVQCQDGLRPGNSVFAELIRRYHPYVDNLLYHLAPDWNDRADLAQEVWVRVFSNIRHLREPIKFHSWLSRITTNLFCTELRKRKRLQSSLSLDSFYASEEGDIGWKLASDKPNPSETLATQEFYEHLHEAIADLPEIFRRTIVMREIDGMTYEEIADLTGVPMGTVKSRILRARQRLQSQLSNYLQDQLTESKEY